MCLSQSNHLLRLRGNVFDSAIHTINRTKCSSSANRIIFNWLRTHRWSMVKTCGMKRFWLKLANVTTRLWHRWRSGGIYRGAMSSFLKLWTSTEWLKILTSLISYCPMMIQINSIPPMNKANNIPSLPYHPDATYVD